MIYIREYHRKDKDGLFRFLEKCLPQSGRILELDGRHNMYCKMEEYFDQFWCLFDGEKIIGTAALKKLDEKRCELKSLYLLEEYHQLGWGRQLLKTALLKAERDDYKEMYLDTLSTSKKAISLYEKMGFTRIERYNDNDKADVFMVLKLHGIVD